MVVVVARVIAGQQKTITIAAGSPTNQPISLPPPPPPLPLNLFLDKILPEKLEASWHA